MAIVIISVFGYNFKNQDVMFLINLESIYIAAEWMEAIFANRNSSMTL